MDGIVTVRLVDPSSGRPLTLGVNAGGDLVLSDGTSPVRIGVTGPVEVHGAVGITGQVNVQGAVGVTGLVNMTGPSRLYGYDGANWQRARLDASTFALETIEYEHHEIHAGSLFKADINTDDLDDEGVNDALHISFVTPNTTRWPHIVYLLHAAGEADFSLIEAPTGGVTGGSALAVYNRNRNSATVSTVISTHDGTPNQVTQDASAPNGGTEIHHEKMGVGKNKLGGESRDVNEFILRQNTTYSFRMTSTVDAIRAQMTVNWYEHTDRA